MPINITDEFHAATTKGKIASAKEVFLTGDKENLQQIGEKTHQLEDSIKNIAATGGASTAAAVTFDNAASGMTAVNAQGAIEELNTKNKTQDTELAKKANATDITSQMQAEQTRVDAELDKKFNKEYIAQELGQSEIRVLSQKAATKEIKAINSIVKTLSSTLNTNAVYGGVATPKSKAPSPDSPIFYIAYQPGTYTNFGGVTITCLSIITWRDEKWDVVPIFDILSNVGRSGVQSTPLTLSEVISSIPTSERIAGKLVIFRNSDNNNKHALAIFNSDAYISGWTDESNWVVINFSDLNNIINKPITETKIADGAVTETKIAKKAIDFLKHYDNTKTILDAATFQDAIDKILTSYYAGGIVNINARYGLNSQTTYSLESAIAAIPSFEKTWIKGILYFKNNTSRPTMAFYIGHSKSDVDNIKNWVEIDIKNMLSISHFTYSNQIGTPPEALSLLELIEKIPSSERVPGKVVFFKNKQSTYSLAIFNSDAYISGWTNENNWVVVDALDLNKVNSIKQVIDDINVLKSSINDKSNEINQLKESLTDKVDKISGKVLSTNDYTNEDKEKLDAITIPTIPNSVIKNAVDTYVEENNADLSLKDKTLNVITNYTYKLKENVLGTPVSIGTNWSGDMESGFTHTAGSEEALEFDISAIPLNSKILIRFDATNLKENVDIFVSVGDLPKIKSYNGTTSFKAGVIYTGGTLKFIPTNKYEGTISNIKCQVISDSGTELLEDRQDVIYNTRKNFVYGFWNIFMGGSETALKAQNITRSIAIGNYALKDMAIGNRNVAIGTFALPMAKKGENNVAIGADTIYPLIEAYNCVGIGKGTLGGSKSADSCVAVGSGAMGIWASDYDRKNCVAVGVKAGIPIAENCTHVGYRAGANVVGKNNTSIGYNSMCYGTAQVYGVTGENLVCVGYKAEVANTPEAKAAVNSMALGANTTITKSNQVVLGNTAVEEVLIAGKKIIFYEDGTMRWENIT